MGILHTPTGATLNSRTELRGRLLMAMAFSQTYGCFTAVTTPRAFARIISFLELHKTT